MRAIERLNEYGLASGDFTPTFESADIRRWCKDAGFAAGIAEKAIQQCEEATELARDETATMFWPTADTVAEVIASAQAELAESEEWPPKPAPLPEITEPTAKENRKRRKGQLLIGHDIK